MSIERNDSKRCVRATGTSAVRSQRDAKGPTLQDGVQQVQTGEGDQNALLIGLAPPLNSSDPLARLCCCKFKRLGHGYILYERRGDAKTYTLVVVGPHWIGVLITSGIILLCTGMFLFQRMATMPFHATLLTWILCAVTLYYLLRTACADPGIVQPLRTTDGLSRTLDELEAAELEAGDGGAGDDGRSCARRRRFCDICGIHQDRSTQHCDDCGACIAGYDHHCPWMGKCIGRGNQHAFRMFNVSWVIYVVFVLCIAISSTDEEHTRA